MICDLSVCGWKVGGGDGGELLEGKSFEKDFYEISKTISTDECLCCFVRSFFHYNAVT